MGLDPSALSTTRPGSPDLLTPLPRADQAASTKAFPENVGHRTAGRRASGERRAWLGAESVQDALWRDWEAGRLSPSIDPFANPLTPIIHSNPHNSL